MILGDADLFMIKMPLLVYRGVMLAINQVRRAFSHMPNLQMEYPSNRQTPCKVKHWSWLRDLVTAVSVCMFLSGRPSPKYAECVVFACLLAMKSLSDLI